jgi:hypothetical protein
MPMTAEQLAALIDQVWEELGTRPAVPKGVLADALQQSAMFNELQSFVALNHTVPQAWVGGLLIGIQLGKAIREVEELEGLGR